MFELLNKKCMAKEFRVFLLQKLSLSSEKYGFGIRDPEKSIPDPGSRGQKGTGSGSATLPKTYGSYGSGNQNLRNLYYFLFMME
jgi:hypothetical protein